jgi:imidazolonepropionase-like amidohydrolase
MIVKKIINMLGLAAVTMIFTGLAFGTDTGQKAPLARSGSAASSVAIVGGTVIDGTGGAPLERGVVLVRDGRIAAIGAAGKVALPKGVKTIDASGRFIIPGLIDGNVHLTFGTSVEYLARYEDRLEDLAEQSAQVALKAGVTTVFDTWGPLQPLMNVRDRISRGEVPGSRMFVAGTIIGFSGPLGRDFNPDPAASKMFRKKINGLWEENVGPELGFLAPDALAAEIRKYIGRGPDFLKYGASGHSDDAVLLFSENAQKAIVGEGHRAGLTVQCHTSNVESLRMAVEAGNDLITHADITEREPIPESTLAALKAKNISCGVLPETKKKLEASLKRFAASNPPSGRRAPAEIRALNVSQMIQYGIPLILTTDAGIWSPEVVDGMPAEAKVDRLDTMGKGHFIWCRAMAEKGMAPMDILLCCTRNVARAYHKLDRLGTLEAGKVADIVILEADPLADIGNLEKIWLIMKDGLVVDRDKLPLKNVVQLPAF